MRSAEDLTKLVNQSGFPLQMAVAELISSGSTGWSVHSQENGWRNSDGQSGFIDIVLEDHWQTSMAVIECKRVQGAEWLFLCDPRQSSPTRKTRLWITNTVGHGREYLGYYDARCDPASYESMFCVVAGQDPKARPMLERNAAELASATEALALEEHPVMVKRKYGIRMYISVIVTTARLILSRVDPTKIALANGEVAEADHEDVPWIRFRKALSYEPVVESGSSQFQFGSLARAKEKLVFVVNVLTLEDFLRRWSVDNDSLRALM